MVKAAGKPGFMEILPIHYRMIRENNFNHRDHAHLHHRNNRHGRRRLQMKLWSCWLILKNIRRTYMVNSVIANNAFSLTWAQGRAFIVRVKLQSNWAWMEAHLGHAAKEAKHRR
jgi:hypothetical protein